MDAQGGSSTTFRECQRYRGVWLRALVGLMAALGWWALIQQVILGKPFGNRPASDLVVVVLWLVFGVGLPGLFWYMHLVTEVRADGGYVRFVPFHLRWRRFAFEDIASCEARTYRPLREYGGWGIRWGPGGWAYNVSGNRGAQLVLRSGKRVLLGSQRADELAAAIAQGRGR